MIGKLPKRKAIVNFLIFLLTFSWFFFDWLTLWDNPPIPPKIPEVLAGGSCNAPSITLAGGSYTGIQTTTMTINGACSTICYTTNGSTPTASNGSCTGATLTYSGAVTINQTMTINAIGVGNGKGDGGPTSASYTITVDTPTFGTNGGSFNDDTSTTISDAFTGAVICYTTDGSTPGASTPGTCNTSPTQTYSGAVSITATGTVVKAIATKANTTNSTVATSNAFTLTVGAITSSPGAGTYSSAQNVTLNVASTTGAIAHYTTDGTAVSCSSTTYTGAFNLSSTTTVKAIGCKTNYVSDTPISDLYTINILPTVTTQAASSVKDATATANGNITNTGGENNDKEGFVYDTSTKTLPGNVAPTSSGYASYAENTGSFGTGAFTVSLTGLSGGITYYGRAYSHNSTGYSYGNEVSFTTAVISITVTSSGVISYGFIGAGISEDTTSSGLNNTQTVQNTSTIAENFNIKTSNATGGTQWTLGASSGADVFVHEFSTNGGSVWTKFTTADVYQTLVTGIAANGAQNFDLRITAPLSSTDYQQKSITVTVQAVAQ